MFFNSWGNLVRILIVGVLAYAGLIILQRISGKRTLSKMNAFDLVVTVALGSGLATIILSKDVSLAEGLVALALLMGLQFIITLLSTRWKRSHSLIKSEPRLLLFKGEILKDALNEERVLEAEIRQAVRSMGMASLNDIEAVVLETDGSFSVIKKNEESPSALSDIRLPERDESCHMLTAATQNHGLC